MWKKITSLLIVLSVALNIAFAGVWAVRAVRSYWTGRGHGGNGRKEGITCPLHRRLNVTDKQWQRLGPRLEKFCRDSQDLCQDLIRKRVELIDMVASPRSDRQAIAAKQDEILVGQRRVQQLVIEQLQAEKETLTPQQQDELFNLLRQRSGCAHPMMMGLSETESGTAPCEHPDLPGVRDQGE